jgi:hypothetical protein
MSAMELLDSLKTQEISIGTVLRIHEIIGKGALNDDSSDYLGMFRDGPVYVGDNHENVDYKLMILDKSFGIRAITLRAFISP